MTDKLPMMIAVRGYAVPVDTKRKPTEDSAAKPERKIRKALPAPANVTVIFDTETTTDQAQNLRFGTYQVRKGTKRQEHGIFYEPGNVTADELALLRSYTAERRLSLRTREDFVREVLYVYGYDHGGLILGFNLPFDLSRLATRISTSHGKDMRGGFSLELLSEKWRPNILVKHLNSRAAFIRFAAAPGPVDGRGMRNKGFKTRAKTGYFQDVKTVAAATLGRSHSLASLANHLQTPHRKLDTDEHGGALTADYLDYAVTDTQVTWECYCELRKRYDAHGLTETSPHRIYSEASLGKAYLRQMAVAPWAKLQPDFSPDMLGIIMSTYYGGRAEVRIRRQMARVLYCDFRSMYPTVCTLMKLWLFVIATGIDHEDWTDETRMLLARVGLRDLRYRNLWPFLTTLVQIVPDDDVLPVRARYGDSRTIGLNRLSAGFGLWYTLADCIASKLHTGKAPKIIRAIRFTPRASQEGLKPITIGGNDAFRIDPNDDGLDLYKRIIELRGQVQSTLKAARADGRKQDAEELDAYQQMLKLLANSTSYGIFAEMNVVSHDHLRQVACYSPEDRAFHTGTKSVEELGSHFHPLLATLITGAARLMLSIAEKLAADAGIGWALCDTDSLALARPDGMDEQEFLKRAVDVTNWFDALNPYDDSKPLFKIEDQNFRSDGGRIVPGDHEPLYALAISAKRYVLFNLDSLGKPIIRKAVAHGLGHWRTPYRDGESPALIPAPVIPLSEIGAERWQYDLWHQIILAELEGHPDQVDLSPLTGLQKPAASRYSASTPALRHWFDRFNKDRPDCEQVKAFNFFLSYQVSPTALYAAIASGDMDASFVDDGLPAVVAPFDDDPVRGATRCFDRRSGRPVPVSALATYREAVADYHLHAESKFANAETTDRGVTERRHIQAVAVEYIGKEANRWEEQYYLGEMPDAQIEYGTSAKGKCQLLKLIAQAARKFGKSTLANVADLSRQQLSKVMALQSRPRPQTVKALLRAITDLETERASRRATDAAAIAQMRRLVEASNLSAVSARLGIDPSNLAKMLTGKRPVTVALTRDIEQLPHSPHEPIAKVP